MGILKKMRIWLLPKVSHLFPGFSQPPNYSDLASAVQESLQDWHLAKEQFNHVDPGLIDYMVYRLNAAERHYMALLSLAKNQGVKAWPDLLVEPVKNQKFESALQVGIQNPESRIQNGKHSSIGV